MSQFEFLFSLFTIVMGLSLVELLAGLGRSLEFKLGGQATAREFAFGWTTPLLAVFVILDLLSFWIFAWGVRDTVVVTAWSIVSVVAFSGCYYLAARLVFPSEPEFFRDLDTHFFRVRKVVFSLLMLLVVMQWTFVLLHPALRHLAAQPVSVGLTIVLLALMAFAMVLKDRRWVTAVLLALVARYLVIYVF